jgi:uncharacterized membrane protein required for colicin V production
VRNTSNDLTFDSLEPPMDTSTPRTGSTYFYSAQKKSHFNRFYRDTQRCDFLSLQDINKHNFLHFCTFFVRIILCCGTTNIFIYKLILKFSLLGYFTKLIMWLFACRKMTKIFIFINLLLYKYLNVVTCNFWCVNFSNVYFFN